MTSCQFSWRESEHGFESGRSIDDALIINTCDLNAFLHVQQDFTVQFQPVLVRHAFRDVAGKPQQKFRLTMTVFKHDLARMKNTASEVTGFDHLFRDVQETPLDDFAILGRKEVGLFPGEQVVIIFAQHIFAFDADQLFPSLVE